MAQLGPKNIVICCDGTGNEFGDANSNVVKLYTALAIDDEQVGYYHPGVGTMGNPGERYRLARWWSQIEGLAFAAGFKDKVFDAYRYLMEVYNDGDQVCLFGFSRGAYTVRALAGLLNGYGLLCPGNEGHIPYAWRMYADQHQDRTRHSIDRSKDSGAAFKETFSRKDFKIHFIGIWDTVSSVGWITQPLRLFNVAQNPTIELGRHAISIDERRCFYHDNLWGDPLPGQDIVQVWFAGVHSDVGGSYPQSESGLSNITLKWMIDEAKAAGIKFMPDRVNLVLGNPSVTYPADRPLYPKPTSSVVHRSLHGLFWWLLECFPHLYYDKDYGKEHYRVPLGARRQLPDGALVHYTVKERMDDQSKAYTPPNVTCGALAPLNALLYKYQPPSNTRSNTLGRWAVMVLFILLDLIVALGILLLVIRLSPPLGNFVLHLCGRLLHWISVGYSDLGAWVMSHFGSTIHKIFFRK